MRVDSGCARLPGSETQTSVMMAGHLQVASTEIPSQNQAEQTNRAIADNQDLLVFPRSCQSQGMQTHTQRLGQGRGS